MDSTKNVTQELTITPDGHAIQTSEGSISFELAEQIARQLDDLREQSRGRRERAELSGGLRAFAGWLDANDVGPIYSLDSLAVFLDNDRVAEIAGKADLLVELAPFGSGPDRLQASVEFGPVKLRIVGQTVDSEVSA